MEARTDHLDLLELLLVHDHVRARHTELLTGDEPGASEYQIASGNSSNISGASWRGSGDFSSSAARSTATSSGGWRSSWSQMMGKSSGQSLRSASSRSRPRELRSKDGQRI